MKEGVSRRKPKGIVGYCLLRTKTASAKDKTHTSNKKAAKRRSIVKLTCRDGAQRNSGQV